MPDWGRVARLWRVLRAMEAFRHEIAIDLSPVAW